MSRRYDRIRARGTVPLTASDLIYRALGHNPRAMLTEVRASERPLHPRELPEMPVVDAGNVARYVAELRHEVKVSDIVSIVVPPFRRMFVETQGAPSDLELRSWGADISILNDRTNPNTFNPKDAWVV